ncbi:hypothetical protein QFZ40_001075 [Arthrobacter pascens]|uniref:hypothetical protein n=1 Tax=Arthrobacter pascens TaxID=1677 RepID=UPI0027892522|nr:hypothetical protein [Arthrobacter pascens]MDQ0633166.1 hypothetical protein [Arthrobacter pascens]
MMVCYSGYVGARGRMLDPVAARGPGPLLGLPIGRGQQRRRALPGRNDRHHAPLPTQLEDESSQNKRELLNGKIESTLNETLDRLCEPAN